MTPKAMMLLLGVAALTATAGAAHAGPVTRLQPGEAASKDVLLYQFNIGGFFGIPTPPASTNLDTETLNKITPPPVPFGSFLGSAETDPFTLTPGGPLREHGTRSLLQFDLGGIALKPSQVANARLRLFGLPALSAFESPDAAHPVTSDLRRVLTAWDEQTATWDTQPDVAAMPTATVVQASVNTWFDFDVTDLVRDWLSDPGSNLGVEISQRDVVEMDVPGARERYFASLYASSAYPDAALRPILSIEAVPEPSSIAALAAGVFLVGTLGRRRKAG